MHRATQTPRRARDPASAERGHLAFDKGQIRRQAVGQIVDENVNLNFVGSFKQGHPEPPVAHMHCASGQCLAKRTTQQLPRPAHLPCRHTHPPRAMIAAQSTMMTMAASSAWMTAVMRLRLFASITGTCPALSAPRQDKNSIVGMIDNSPTMMKSENLVRKAWL